MQLRSTGTPAALRGLRSILGGLVLHRSPARVPGTHDKSAMRRRVCVAVCTAAGYRQGRRRTAGVAEMIPPPQTRGGAAGGAAPLASWPV